jgi:hypothetical protein
MGVSAAVAAVATVGSAAVQQDSSRKARHSAEDQAKAEREQLAQLAAQPENVIPTADDQAVKDARRRSITAQLRRRGRASTILTGDSSVGDTLGA